MDHKQLFVVGVDDFELRMNEATRRMLGYSPQVGVTGIDAKDLSPVRIAAHARDVHASQRPLEAQNLCLRVVSHPHGEGP